MGSIPAAGQSRTQMTTRLTGLALRPATSRRGGTTAAAAALSLVALAAPLMGTASAATGGATAGTRVQGYVTTADLSRTLAPLPSRTFSATAAASGAEVITVDPSATGQR